MDDLQRLSPSSAWRRTALTVGCLHVPQSSLHGESLTGQRAVVHPARPREGCECEQWRCTLMSRAYWRSPGTYKKLQTFDAPGFAFQVPNRNPEVVKDRGRLQQKCRPRALDASVAYALTHRE